MVEHVLHPQPGYPFSLAVGIEYALSDEGLTVATTATNVGQERVPVRLRRPPVPDARDADRRPRRTDGARPNGAAVGRPRPPHRPQRRRGHGVRLHPAEGDRRDATRPLLHRPRARRRCRARRAPALRTGRRSLTLWLDEAYGYLQLFTGDPLPDVDRRSLAVEPMTCPPNAYRTGEALIRLEPGRSFTSRWGITSHAREHVNLVAAGTAAGRGLARARARRRECRRDSVQAAPPGRPAHGRAGDRARDPHRPRRAGPRAGRQPHRLPRRPRPRLPVLLRRPRAGRAARGSPVARPRNDRLGDLDSRSASPSASPCTRPASTSAAWLLGVALSTTALGTLVPILADAGLLPTHARLGGARHRCRGRVLADRRDLDLPHRRVRRGGHRDAAPFRLRRRRAGRSGGCAPRAPAGRGPACSSRPCTRQDRLPCACPSSSSPGSSSSRSRSVSTSCSARSPEVSSSAWH